MPLIKSSSDKARSTNIATEIRAGKKPAQAEAIAYSVQRESKHPHHSGHSAERSKHYHSTVTGQDVRPVEVLHKFGATTKMHKSEHAPQTAEDATEKGHKL